MRGRVHVDDEKTDGQKNQRQSGDVDGQNRGHIQEQDEGDGAGDARKNRARIADLADDAVHGDQHQHEHHLGPPEQLKELLARRPRDGDHVCAGRFQFLVVNFSAVDLLKEIGQVFGDQINDVEVECFFGSGRLAVNHSGPGPLHVAMPAVGNGFDESGGVVLHFFLHHVIGFLRVAAHADGNRVRGTDGGIRRHRRDVRRERDERARAARACAGG